MPHRYGNRDSNFEAEPEIGDLQARPRLHDSDAAELSLKIAQDTADPTSAALTHFVRGRLAADAGDAAIAATELEAFAFKESESGAAISSLWATHGSPPSYQCAIRKSCT